MLERRLSLVRIPYLAQGLAEVVETDFFRDLQAKASMLRSQRQRKTDQELDQDSPTKNE